jgi:hypothetical protein
MKKADKKSVTVRDFDELVSKFSENEILNVFAMQHVRGGDGPADGGGDSILFPPKPPQP